MVNNTRSHSPYDIARAYWTLSQIGPNSHRIRYPRVYVSPYLFRRRRTHRSTQSWGTYGTTVALNDKGAADDSRYWII